MKTAYCFDLDGTITRDEILPVLAREIGLFEEIGALTEATIKGLIPFRKSFLLRCRLLAEIPVSRVQEIIHEQVRLYDDVVAFIQEHRKDCFVITGNIGAWVDPLLRKLDCRVFTSEAEVENDRLKSVTTVLDKGQAIQSIRSEYDRLVAIGDGMGDVPMFEHAHLRVAFGATHEPIQTLVQLSDYVVFHEASLCRLLKTL